MNWYLKDGAFGFQTLLFQYHNLLNQIIWINFVLFWFPLQISKESDIVIENFLPGKLDTLSLGYDAISKVNPQIIYCSITGFGPGGPDKLLPGYDLIASAIGGGMSVTGYEVKHFCKRSC